MKKKIFIILGILILVGFLGFAAKYFFGERQVVSLEQPEKNVKEINMTAFQFGFDPNTITVNKGDKVIIHLINKDLPHGLNLDEFDVHIAPAPKGEVRTVEFIADKVGTFFYFCNNPYCGEGHNRQIGKFIVK